MIRVIFALLLGMAMFIFLAHGKEILAIICMAVLFIMNFYDDEDGEELPHDPGATI